MGVQCDACRDGFKNLQMSSPQGCERKSNSNVAQQTLNKIHADFRLALLRCSWPSPRAFADADYANQAWFPCIAWRHRSIECQIRAVLVQCWKGVHCLSAAWHFRSVHGRLHINKRFAASAVTCTILQLRTSGEKNNKFVGNKTAIYGRNRSVLSLSNSLVFVSVLRLSDRSHMKEQARSMPSTQAVTPSPSHNRGGSV